MAESDDWLPAPGDIIDGRYELDSVLDKGGMGVVMRARHQRMEREVAVKFLHPKIARQDGYRQRFEREVKLATKLDHPNVVQCFDYGETDAGVLFLVMELLDGENLRNHLVREGRLSTTAAVGLAEQMVDGIAAAHAQDVIHRDLKPGNLFLVRDYRGRNLVKILDFGMAKSLVDNDFKITRTGNVVGTASYLPPEALLIQHTGKEGDVYAIGLILLELLVGYQAFRGASMTQTFMQQLVMPARIPRRLWDSALGPVLADALIKDPSRRTQDAGTMLSQLVAARDEIPEFVLSPDELPPPLRSDIRSDVLAGISGKSATEAFVNLPDPEPYEAGSNQPVELAARSSSHTPRYPDAKPTLLMDGAPTMEDAAPIVEGAALPVEAAAAISEEALPAQSSGLRAGWVTVALLGIVAGVALAYVASQSGEPSASDQTNTAAAMTTAAGDEVADAPAIDVGRSVDTVDADVAPTAIATAAAKNADVGSNAPDAGPVVEPEPEPTVAAASEPTPTPNTRKRARKVPETTNAPTKATSEPDKKDYKRFLMK